MTITLNKQAQEDSIKQYVTESIQKIEANAALGKEFTDLILPNDYFSQIRTLIEEYMEGTGTKYNWMILSGKNSIPYDVYNRLLRFRLH